MDQEENDLWHRLRSSNDMEARNELIELHLPLVKRAAERMYFSLAGKVEEEELYSSGLLGLIDSIQRYLPSKSVKFSTFSSQRIRGAMLDDIRTKDWDPRLCRQAYQTYQQAYRSLLQELQRYPSDDEMMAKLSLGQEEYHKLCMEMNISSMTSLNALNRHSDDSDRDDDWVADNRQPSEERNRDIKEFLNKMISELPKKKQAALVMYYFEEMTLKEISRVLEVTEGRVSQILSGVLAQLKMRYNRDKEVYL